VLEDKIKEEVASIHEKVEQMKGDMAKFSKEGDVKDSWETRKKVTRQATTPLGQV
jgi:hypothetical protein